MDSIDTAKQLVAAIQTCRLLMPQSQIHIMTSGIRGEEGEYFRAKFLEVASVFDTMPKVYEQDGLCEDAIVYLHYFKGGADWWITERDISRPQHQAFGLADLFGDGGELGYISIVELIRCGVELDLHWTPKRLGDVRRAAA